MTTTQLVESEALCFLLAYTHRVLLLVADVVLEAGRVSLAPLGREYRYDAKLFFMGVVRRANRPERWSFESEEVARRL